MICILTSIYMNENGFDVILIISCVQLYGFSSMFFNAIGSCAESSLVLPSLPQDNALQIEELLDKLSV